MRNTVTRTGHVFVSLCAGLIAALFLARSAQAAILYVSPTGNHTPPFNSWATAATNIQAAIDAASASDTVRVTNGIYQTGGRTVPLQGALTNRVVIDKPIVVTSVNGADVTIIRGRWDPVTTNGPAAVRGVWMTNGAFLIGFTIENGATLATGQPEAKSGGGISAFSSAATISSCIIRNNRAQEVGGGAWGGSYFFCLIQGNEAESGGGAGFWNSPGSVNWSRVFDNTANNGGGIRYGSHTNSLIFGNLAKLNGGGTAQANLYNCTVAGNTSLDASGGAWAGNIENSIVYFNQAPDRDNHSGVAELFVASCTTPLPSSGFANFTNDPLFVSLAATNLMLSAGSPCRDMGDNSVATSAFDFAGNPRIVNVFVDIGAYEFQGSPSNDYDGDGMTTTDERIAGSDPLDPSNVWGFTRIISTSGVAAVSFRSFIGRVYAIERNDNLFATPQTWTTFTNNIPGIGSPLTISDPLPGTNRNYRVRVGFAL